MVLPLSAMSLVQNIKFQLISVATLFFVIVVWIYLFADNGLDLAIPVVGRNQSVLMGFVLSNFGFVYYPAEITKEIPNLQAADHHYPFLRQ